MNCSQHGPNCPRHVTQPRLRCTHAHATRAYNPPALVARPCASAAPALGSRWHTHEDTIAAGIGR
eukprot:11162646-Lingulodinium_polyedra.AAC.1